MIRKTSIKYIYIYIYFIFHNFISNQNELIKKKKNPTTALTLKTENKNDSIKNQNNLFKKNKKIIISQLRENEIGV